MTGPLSYSMRSRDVKRAYLDTNVLIENTWERLALEPKTRKSSASRLLELGQDGRFEIVISTFCIMELYEHFRDWFLLQKVIGSGFGYREFRRERRRHRLSRGEVKILDTLIVDLQDDPDINIVEFERVPKQFFPRMSILQRNGIDSIDSFHILTALDVEVTHFVTKDGDVRSRFNAATKREIEAPPMEMTSIRGFMKTLS